MMTTFYLNSNFTFGKYKGMTLESVCADNPNYISWCVEHIDWFYVDADTLEEIQAMAPNFHLSNAARF